MVKVITKKTTQLIPRQEQTRTSRQKIQSQPSGVTDALLHQLTFVAGNLINTAIQKIPFVLSHFYDFHNETL